MYIDAHLHSFENQDISSFTIIFLNSTHPGDWHQIAELAEKNNNVYPFFGIHPWFLDKAHAGWKTELRTLLEKYPQSGVGEIGLDFFHDDFTSQEQENCFREQIEVALEYSRPFVIHCVKGWGKLVNILKSYDLLNSKFMIHSFNKSSQLMRELVALGGYISYSPVLLGPKAKKVQIAFAETPLERILLETDFPNIHHYSKILEELDWGDIVSALYQRAASLRGMDSQGKKNRFYEVINKNAQVFTN